jgi:hypothetical protein
LLSGESGKRLAATLNVQEFAGQKVVTLLCGISVNQTMIDPEAKGVATLLPPFCEIQDGPLVLLRICQDAASDWEFGCNTIQRLLRVLAKPQRI